MPPEDTSCLLAAVPLSQAVYGAGRPYCAAVSLCEARQGLASRIQVVPNNDDDDWLEKVEGIGVAEMVHVMWD